VTRRTRLRAGIKATLTSGSLTSGRLQDHAIENGWTYPKNSDATYDNMRLVEASVPFIPSAGIHYVKLTYETLTSSWVQEKDDTIDYDLNGLRRVTRTSVALPNTTYSSIVGATSMESSGTTVWLASRSINETDAKWTLTETWIEAGLLSTSFSTDSDGLTSHSQTWLKTVGTTPALPSGVITGRKIGDYQGLQTITIEKKGFPTDGTFTYETTVPFTVPGTVTTEIDNLGPAVVNLMIKATPPIPSSPCDAFVTVTYSADETIDTGAIYRPTTWTSQLTTGIGLNGRKLASYSTYSNHIRIGDGDELEAPVDLGGIECVNGVQLYGGTTGKIELEGPTLDPAGTTITLSISNDPIFKDEGGVQYYKKTVVVINVPART